jgi:beta-galactosidase
MESSARPTLDRAGLRLDGELVPLLSGSVHYWRLPRSAWKPALDALKNLGARLVDTYVPWSVHETAPGAFDFGRSDPRLDVRHFLELSRDAGLYAIVRPGPHINSELTHFGIPERVIWDDACQARSAARGRVVLPIPPLAFPVPSYTSAAFHREARVWLSAVGEQIRPLIWPEGPVVLVQIDNEGSLYFRDGPYDQDYHPDAIAQYRRYLRNRYSSQTALRAAHGDPSATFDAIEPPPELDAKHEDELPKHLDWAEFQESAIEAALYRFANVLKENGLRRIPTFHNLPLAEGATPLDAVRIEHAVDFVALDYYHHASDRVRTEIARRTTSLAARAAIRNVPAFGAEMGAGFAPYFPPLSDADNQFAVLNALAYGLRGFNLYMAVSRDRWIGGPIDRAGVPRPSAEFWKSLFRALERTRFCELVRRTPVRVVVPRSLERLARVVHAFESVPPAAFALGGRGAALGSFENDLDPTHGAVLDAENFLTNLEQALDHSRVPYAVVREDLLSSPPPETRWTIVVCPGALDTALTTTVGERMLRSTPLSVGPRPPERDGAMRPSRARLPHIERAVVPVLLPPDPAELRAAVGSALAQLEIATLPAEPASVHTTVHHDTEGHPRVLFVINASEEPVEALAHAPGARSARDALTLERVLVTGEHVVLPMSGLSVRMLELSPEP